MGDLKNLFEPKSIALIGVSKDPAKLSHMLMHNVVTAGPTCQVYPISRSGRTILGYKAYPNLYALPEPPDLVLVSLAGEHVKEAVAEAAETGVGTVVILSSGFGETREDSGKHLEEELLNIARAGGMRIMGPNCLGIYNAHKNLNGTYLVKAPLQKGNISVASQSGAYGGILVHELNRSGIGLGKFASLGNQLDISHQDVLEYFADDDETNVIGLFVEGIKDGPAFLETLREVSKIKPVVIFKAGRTRAGRRAAASHTGAMVGEFAVAQAAFRQAGAMLARTTEEFHDYLFALSLNHYGLPRNNSVAIVTISGGPSVIAADFCEEIGLEVPQLSDHAMGGLSRLLPSFAAVSNPVDMTVATAPENFGPAVDLVVAEPHIGGVIALNWGWDRVEFARAFVDAAEKYRKPVVAVSVENPEVQDVFRQNCVPILPSPERAVRSYWALRQSGEVKQMKELYKQCTAAASRTLSALGCADRCALNEYESKKVLQEYGIPTCRETAVCDSDGLAAAAAGIGYPVVLKVLAEDVVHKSEKGGVALDIANQSELLSAAQEMAERFSRGISYLVQEKVPQGIEVIVGMKRDQIFGPVIAFGLGGVFTEILGDVALRVHPLCRRDAHEMIREIKGHKILAGLRGSPPADRGILAEIILKVGDVAQANEDIAELDINPLMIRGKDVKVVDACIVLEGSHRHRTAC